jgi:hypothetical protein
MNNRFEKALENSAITPAPIVIKPRRKRKPRETEPQDWATSGWTTRRWDLRPRGSATPNARFIESVAFSDQAKATPGSRGRATNRPQQLAENQLEVQAARDAWQALFNVRTLSPEESAYMARHGCLNNAGEPVPDIDDTPARIKSTLERITAKRAAESERYALAVARDPRLSSDAKFAKGHETACALNLNESFHAASFNPSPENIADYFEHVKQYARRLKPYHYDPEALESEVLEEAWAMLSHSGQPTDYDPGKSKPATWLHHRIGWISLGQWRDIRDRREHEVSMGGGKDLDNVRDHRQGRRAAPKKIIYDQVTEIRGKAWDSKNEADYDEAKIN